LYSCVSVIVLPSPSEGRIYEGTTQRPNSRATFKPYSEEMEEAEPKWHAKEAQMWDRSDGATLPFQGLENRRNSTESRRSNSRIMPLGLDPRSKMEEVVPDLTEDVGRPKRS